MNLLGLYLCGVLVVFLFCWVEELGTPEQAVFRSVVWPILLIKTIYKGFRNRL